MRLAVLLLAGCAAAAPRPVRAPPLDAIGTKAVDDRQTAGLAIAAARAGGVVYERGFGDATARTRFRLASVSKMITAVTALRLVEDGKLALDAPIASYLDGKLAGVTVGMLLAHTSGLADFKDIVEAGARRPAEVLAGMDAQRRAAAPGVELRYANVNFHLLGLVVAKAAGRPLADAIRTLVLEPAGMTGAGFDCGALLGHDKDDGAFVTAAPLPWPDGPEGAASVCATGADVARFGAALAAGRLLRPGTLRLMFAPQRLADGSTVAFGLGAELGSLDGHRSVAHLGGGWGYSTRLVIFPDDDLAIAVLADSSSGRANRLSLEAARAALGSRPGPPAPRPLDAAAHAGYVGDYEFPEQQLTLHVYERDGALYVRGTDAVGDPMVYLGDATFTTPDEPDVQLRFGPAGRLILDYYAARLFGARR